MRHRTPQFGHVFARRRLLGRLLQLPVVGRARGRRVRGLHGGAGGPYDTAVARKLRENIFSVGNTVDPAEAYRSFRGRDPQIEALMRKRGFPTGSGN